MSTTASHRRRPAFGIIALLFLLSVACACPGFSNPGRSAATPVPQSEPSGSQPAPARIGQVVTAASVEANSNRPIDVTTTFAQNTPIIYMVAEVQEIEPGTTVFARWSRNGQPFEDTSTITADRRYTNTFLEFHIQPKDPSALPPGDYSVTLYVNGNPYETVNFTVR